MAQKTSFSKFLRPSYFNYQFIEIVFSIILSIFLLLLSINFPNKNSYIRNSLINFLRPISTVISAPVIEIGLLINKTKKLLESRENNEKLMMTIEDNERKLSEMYHLQIENSKLRSLLNLKAPPSSDSIVSRIIFDPANFGSTNIFIDVGTKDFVKLNNPVFNENGMIGRIINIQEDSSEVLLITDLKSTLPVFSEESKLKFFVTGGKKYLNIKHLESRNALKDGEIILSTSTSGYFKKGIKVGTVRKKVNEIIIEPLAKKNDSVYVKVLIYDFDKLQPNFLK